MKIIWNNKNTKDSVKETQIDLPKPTGNWISVEESSYFEDSDITDEIGTVHIPKTKTVKSIEEINIYEQEIQAIETDSNDDMEITQPIEESTISMIIEPTLFSPENNEIVSIESENNEIVSIESENNETLPIESKSTPTEKECVTPPSNLAPMVHLKELLDSAANNGRFQEHQTELRQIAVFCLSVVTLSLLPYTSPALADYRPWTQEEAAPLISLWTSQQKVTEDENGTLITIGDPVENPFEEELFEEHLLVEHVEEEEILSAANDIAIVVPRKDHLEPLKPRTPAIPEKLHVPKGSLEKYFTQLSLIEDGTDRVARALVWGDSTIANDGIIKDVRARMQERFGDSGPGFLAAKVDKRWAFRRDIVRDVDGSWSAKNIVHGGADDSRYGLAGTVAVAHPGAKSKLGGVKIEGDRQNIHRFQVFYQRRPQGGDLNISTKSKGVSLNTSSTDITDAYYELIVPNGDPYVYLEAATQNVVIYGVALEVDSPGVTWETFGVAGSSISSMQKQHDGHLSNQIAARDPALLVYWTGGNELGYPSLRSSTGKGYKKYYRKVVRNLKEGAPQASCLLIGPLDQAVRVEGQIVSKPTLDKLIRFQREVAEEEGCAYWDARAAMGGANSFRDWLSVKPALASPDLAHLTGRGRKRIGDTLADVLMREYDLWRIDNPEIFWTPDESIGDPTGDLWFWECDNPELSAIEREEIEFSADDICSL